MSEELESTTDQGVTQPADDENTQNPQEEAPAAEAEAPAAEAEAPAETTPEAEAETPAPDSVGEKEAAE